MSDIDPFEYGKLTAQVQSLQDKVDSMETDIMAIASAIGGFITFVTNHWLGK